MSRIGVIGTGSWGTALALVLAKRGGHSITMWSHTPVVAEAIRQRHENSIYLPGLFIPDCVAVTTDLQEAVDHAEILILAVPSEHLRSICCAMAPLLTSEQLIVNATKGIEDGTYLRMTQVMGEVLGEVRSGASLRRAQRSFLRAGSRRRQSNRNHYCLLRSGHRDPRTGRVFQPLLAPLHQRGCCRCRARRSTEECHRHRCRSHVRLELGHNSVAALITRGIAEMTRLAVACGGRRETLAGLSGLGDLVLTCTGALSRNRHVGLELGSGRCLKEILVGHAWPSGRGRPHHRRGPRRCPQGWRRDADHRKSCRGPARANLGQECDARTHVTTRSRRIISLTKLAWTLVLRPRSTQLHNQIGKPTIRPQSFAIFFHIWCIPR